MRKKKNLDQFSKNYRTSYSNTLPLSSQKYGFGIRDPRSGKKPIPDPERPHIPDPGYETLVKNFAFLGQAVPHGEGGELPGPGSRLGPHSSGQRPLLQDPVHHSLSLSALFLGAMRSLFGR